MSMTNEQLAELIKNGEQERIGELWENVCKLYRIKAQRFYICNKLQCQKSGVEFNDLYQCCYLALLDTVRAYNPQKGYKFTAYIDFHFRNAMNEAIGKRSRKKDPLNNCKSLDDVMDEESGETFIEFIEDKAAFEEYEKTDKDITIQELREELETALNKLPPKQAYVLRLRYFEGLTQRETAQRLSGISLQAINQLEKTAFRGIRKSSNNRKLESFRKELIASRAYQKTSLFAFKCNNASSVELTYDFLEYQEKMTKWLEEIKKS